MDNRKISSTTDDLFQLAYFRIKIAFTFAFEDWREIYIFM